jgi:hypothetical protein
MLSPLLTVESFLGAPGPPDNWVLALRLATRSAASASAGAVAERQFAADPPQLTLGRGTDLPFQEEMRRGFMRVAEGKLQRRSVLDQVHAAERIEPVDADNRASPPPRAPADRAQPAPAASGRSWSRCHGQRAAEVAQRSADAHQVLEEHDMGEFWSALASLARRNLGSLS